MYVFVCEFWCDENKQRFFKGVCSNGESWFPMKTSWKEKNKVKWTCRFQFDTEMYKILNNKCLLFHIF
jgi:hypothetical protein